jgi:hypothetical protein
MDPVHDVIDEHVVVSVEENLDFMLSHQAVDLGLFSGIPSARAAAPVGGVQGIPGVASGGVVHADKPEPLRRLSQGRFEPGHLFFAQRPLLDSVRPP